MVEEKVFEVNGVNYAKFLHGHNGELKGYRIMRKKKDDEMIEVTAPDIIASAFVKDLTDFAHWVAKEVISDDNWIMNCFGFQEVACRKLAKIGIIKEKDGRYVYESENK